MKTIALVLACMLLPPAGPAAARTHLAGAAPPAEVVLDHVRRGDIQRLPGGESLRRYTFEPAAQPRLRLTPAPARAGADELRVRVQNAMPWAVTLVVDIEGDAGAHLHATVGPGRRPPERSVSTLTATDPEAYDEAR